MSVIRLKINETIVNKHTGEKNPNHLQVLLLTGTETIFRIFLSSQETSTRNQFKLFAFKIFIVCSFRSQIWVEDFPMGRS